jgi:hypothetical protein
MLTEQTLSQAKDARESARIALRQAEQARDEAREGVDYLRSNVKLMLEMDRLTPKLVLESYDTAKVEKVRRKIEEFAVPDRNERKKWLESLK